MAKKNYKIIGMTYSGTVGTATNATLNIKQTLLNWTGGGNVDIECIDLSAAGSTSGTVDINGKTAVAETTGTGAETKEGTFGEITLNKMVSVTVAISDSDFSVNNLEVYLVEINQQLPDAASTITV